MTHSTLQLLNPSTLAVLAVAAFAAATAGADTTKTESGFMRDGAESAGEL